MDTPLPPFGVRGLCSTDSPFTVLQVSENQYDASIKANPDSALTWLDDDDGETITVGRGSELRDRLDDPTPSDAPLIRFHNSGTQRQEDRYIHLFDISQSHFNGRFWLKHQLAFSNVQGTTKSTTPLGSPKLKAVQTPESLPSAADSSQPNSLEPIDKPSPVSTIQDKKREVSVVESSTNSSTAVPELINILGDQLGNLAGFLQGTSEILRKVAEKTREADTTPIEDILSGMTTILGEVGAFGLDMLETVDRKLAEKSENTLKVGTSVASSCNGEDSSTQRSSTATAEDVNKLSFTEKGDVDMSDLSGQQCEDQSTESNPPTFAPSVELPRVKMVLLPEYQARLAWLQAESKRSLEALHTDDISVQRYPSLAVPFQGKEPSIATTVASGSSNVKLESKEFAAQPISIATQTSILDQDAEDADFAARYPPLTSLRRVRTVACPRFTATRSTKSDTADSSNGGEVSSTRTNIKRPSPQIFDAETLRRKDFAHSCFPAQEYTPGLGPIETKGLGPIEIKRARRPGTFVPGLHTDSAAKSIRTSPVSTESPYSIALGEALPTAPVQDSQSQSCPDAVKYTSNVPKAEEASFKSLPGAWPDVKSEKVEASAHPVEESSGDFFNRMVRQARQSGNLHQDILCRTEPIKDHEHERQSRLERKKEAKALRRAHTVSATNPAARLTYPFDPLFPPSSFAQKDTDSSPSSLKHNVPGPIRSLHRSSTERRPRGLYEPYRPFQYSRSFSPVWEDHLQLSGNTKNTEDRQPLLPKDKSAVVFANNFGPEFTEEDIRAVVEDHCRDAQGCSGLKDCTIIARQPAVAARLIVKNEAMAEQLIAIFDKMTLGGRLLSFSNWRTSSERHEGSSNTPGLIPAIKGPQRMRSMPTFASPARAAPVAVTIASKPTVIPSAPVQQRPNSPVVRPVLSTRRLTLENIDHCEKQLKVMGYGIDDPALASRLHVYAAAANGDVEEAIELIDEDKQAHCAAVNTKENKDLEWALRNSQGI